MTSRQRELLDHLFEEALPLPSEQQPAWVAEHCDDPEVRRELESLLAFATLSSPPGVDAIGHAAASLAGDALIGQRVGPYRLTGHIGQGGMGSVYRARRDDDEYQQTVAIKMLRFAHVESAGLQLFRRERQILATLEHPHIARLLDGGGWVPPGSAESQPYIVMEYVEGLPLTRHCQEKRLSIRQRLMLFQQVCEALSYAHQRLVVHRDIKPGNILVTADGTPKLLDFGIAKLLELETGSDAATRTATQLGVMTPDYASPEQVRGDLVSTLTDVYSLGAVLYEMLTGARPHRFTTHDPLEVIHQICEHQVRPPSLIAGRALRGDLDVIVLKAMQKEPARRYDSAEQFAEDVRRYLEGLPIVARPDTLAYRSAKFFHRHWLGLAAIAAVFLALVGGIAASTWQAMRANAERSRAVAESQRADTESATAKAVNEFLRDDLLAQAGASTQATPDTRPNPNLTVRTALDRAALRIGVKFAAKPLVEASIRQTMGAAYHDLGLFPEAQQQWERALELQRRMLGQEHPDVVPTMTELAGLYILQGKYGHARPLLTKILEVHRRVLGPAHRKTLNAMDDVGELFSYDGDDARAETLLASALEGKRRALGPEDPDTLTSMSNLGVLYRVQGKYAQAEPLLLEAMRIRERVVGPEHPDTLTSAYELAVVYQRQGKYTQAEPLLRNAVNSLRRVLGPDHPNTLTVTSGLVFLYLGEKKYGQAEALEIDLVGVRRRVLGEEHPDTINSLETLAGLYFRQRKYDRAERLLEQVAALRRRVVGPRHRDTIGAMAGLAQVRIHQEKYASAELLLRTALHEYEVTMPEHWRRYHTQSLIGASLAGQGKLEQAELFLLNGYRGLLQRETSIPASSRPDLVEAGEWIVLLYQHLGKPVQAAQWRQRLRSRESAGFVLK